MDHSEVQQNHAVERYLLSEMSGAERDGFEEHYFDCRLCTEDVVEGAKLLAAGRRVALEAKDNVVPMPRRWTAWMPAAAAAVLVIIAAGIGLPGGSNSPSLELAQDHSIDFNVPRAAGTAETVIESRNPILYVTLPADASYPSYEIIIRDSSGKRVTSLPVTAAQASEQIPLLPRSLQAGSYALAVDGVRDGKHTEIEVREFKVR